MQRVIAGSARRVGLAVAPGSAARPMLELARGAVFNSLADRVVEARVLDLFAGSGALGIEALSRGASECVFVEQDPRSARVIAENLEKCRLRDRARIETCAVQTVWERLAGRFDLVFLDPPFAVAEAWAAAGWERDCADRLQARLAEAGRVIFRVEGDTAPPAQWPGFSLRWERAYGRSLVRIYGVADRTTE